MKAKEPDIRGADRVREVFNRVREGDTGVADLYAENAVVLHGSDGRAEGREAIRLFYKRAIDSIHPQPRVEAVLEAPPLFVALVEVPTDTGLIHALDLFEVGDDGIRRLEIYPRHDGSGAPSQG